MQCIHWKKEISHSFKGRAALRDNNWIFDLFRRLILAIKSELAFYDSVFDSVNTIVGIKTSLESH